MSVITALRASSDGRAVRVERDGAAWLRLPVHLVADLRLSRGEEMDGPRVAEIEEAAALERLWEAALRFTVGRGRAEREIVQRLRDRRATEPQVERVMARLLAAGLGDEEANADLRVERLVIRGWASRRIRGEMTRAGFAPDVIRRAIDEGLPADHDARLLTAMVERTGVPDSAADRRRVADRLVRRGLPPAAVREALRPEEGERGDRETAPEADELIGQVRRRYPAQGSDHAERRRALGWLARRGVGPDDCRRILEAAAGQE